MTITVYWSSFEESWMKAKEPKNIYKDFIKKTHLDPGEADISKCPSVKEAMKNVYGLRSMFDYSFSLEKDSFYSNMFDQNFLNTHVVRRSEKLFSFVHTYIFFTEEKSLKMTGQMFPFLEDNFASNSCLIFPGSFDIGKWFRNTEFAFFLKDGVDHFSIKEDDIYMYIKFHTDEKIVFKKFIPTEKIKFMSTSTNCLNRFSFYPKKLDDYYKNLTFKNKILKEIKENLVD
jgi:hypothetical protein